VVPGAKTLLAALSTTTAVLEAGAVTRDFTHLATLSREQQEGRILELAESGQTMAAIHAARALYGYDLTQAKEFVDGLRGRSAGGAVAS
jgi:ribosomal protein L7/L12